MRHPHTIVHVLHGMTEHMGLYAAFAGHMACHGVLVTGFDLPGHGANGAGSSCAAMGETGWEDTLEDIHRRSLALVEQYPHARHYMLGFSLGSFLLREYLSGYPHDHLSGVILMGTGHQSPVLLKLIGAVVDTQIKKAGRDNTTDLVRRLSFGTYNDKFRPNRTIADWLCADEGALDVYLQDPLCLKDISSGLFRRLLESMTRTDFSGWRRELPILLLSGSQDPVGDFGKGVRALQKRMQAQGLKAELRLIPQARHALLWENTACAPAAEKLILDFLSADRPL